MSEHRLTLLTIAGLAIVGVIAAILFLTTREVSVVVAGHDWRREIRVENFIPRNYTDWVESVPGDAYNETCWRAQRGSHQIQTGTSCTTTCSGIGEDRTCRQSCSPTYTTIPDYDTKCSYTADRWGYERSLVTEGHKRADTPTWAALDFTPCAALNCEREGSRSALYQVYFTDDTDTFPCPVDESMWAEYRVGDDYQMRVGRFIHIPRCETITSEGGAS